MSDETTVNPTPITEGMARRRFLNNLGKAAVTAPAIGLLLAASSKPAAAQYRNNRQTPQGPPTIFPGRGQGPPPGAPGQRPF